MAAVIMQGIGATTALSSAKYKNSCFASRRSLPERKRSFFLVHCDGSLTSGLDHRNSRSARLSPNAVATKQTASTATKPGHELLLFEALREGLEEEMDRDPCVCVMGEDVGHYGGSYKVTKGLATKYGDLRVLDTPIAENSFTGMAIGAAMTGALHVPPLGESEIKEPSCQQPADPVAAVE